MYISPLIITQSAAQFIVEKDFFPPSVVCLILLGWCVAGLQLKAHLKTFEDLHRRCFFLLSLNSATEGRETGSNTRGRTSEYDFRFPLRRTGVRGSAHVYGCSHRYAACCGFVCDRMCKHAYMHVSLFIFSPLSHALACFFSL